MKQTQVPIGFLIAQTAKKTTRHFSDRLVDAGGSLSSWLILLALNSSEEMLQSDLSEQIGVQGPTLTHHLNAMEKLGHINRIRLSEDRRAHLVVLTQNGKRHFNTLKQSAKHYDAKLSAALNESEMKNLRAYLYKLANAASP
jgi:MarR family transcriptional regulator, transcriptional regulator for hemolysin